MRYKVGLDFQLRVPRQRSGRGSLMGFSQDALMYRGEV